MKRTIQSLVLSSVLLAFGSAQDPGTDCALSETNGAVTCHNGCQGGVCDTTTYTEVGSGIEWTQCYCDVISGGDWSSACCNLQVALGDGSMTAYQRTGDCLDVCGQEGSCLLDIDDGGTFSAICKMFGGN